MHRDFRGSDILFHDFQKSEVVVFIFFRFSLFKTTENLHHRMRNRIENKTVQMDKIKEIEGSNVVFGKDL